MILSSKKYILFAKTLIINLKFVIIIFLFIIKVLAKSYYYFFKRLELPNFQIKKNKKSIYFSAEKYMLFIYNIFLFFILSVVITRECLHLYADSCSYPSAWLRHISVINIFSVQQIICSNKSCPFTFIPR